MINSLKVSNLNKIADRKKNSNEFYQAHEFH